jgi:serine/threonine protein kinase
MRQAGDHENILKIYERVLDQDFVKKGKTKQVNFISLEFAQGGCLFDLVHKNKLTEAHAKYFGLQMVKGI